MIKCYVYVWLERASGRFTEFMQNFWGKSIEIVLKYLFVIIY